MGKFLCHFAFSSFVILREQATEESQRPFAIAQGDKVIFRGNTMTFKSDNGGALLKTYYKEI
jgi:hypothetical protein